MGGPGLLQVRRRCDEVWEEKCRGSASWEVNAMWAGLGYYRWDTGV